jgi:hypothetical protein
LGLPKLGPGGGQMEHLKNMQPRDWMIAAIAFLAGAIIF